MPDGNGQLNVESLKAKLEKLAEPHGCRLKVWEDKDSPGGWRAGFVKVEPDALGLNPILYWCNGGDPTDAMTQLLQLVESDEHLQQ